MFSRMTSKKTARSNSAAATNAAPASTTPAPEASTSTALPPMRTRSGKVLTPLAEGVKTIKSKLTGARRAGKSAAQPSAPARAEARLSNVADAASASTSHKAAPKKRPAKGRTAKGKAPKAKPAKAAPPPAVDDSSASASAPVPVPVPAPVIAPAPAPAPLPAPGPVEAITAGPAAPIADVPPAAPANPEQQPRPEVPENRRLKRQGAHYFDKDGWPLPEGEYLDKDGKVPISALLKEVTRKVDIQELYMRPRTFRIGASIYGTARFQPKHSLPYDPLEVTLPPQMPGPIVFPSVPAPAWEPIVFPAIPPAPVAAPEEARPRIGTRLTRQYAAFFNEEGYPLPTGRKGGEELEPIGERVANILKASLGDGPYPSTWRGSLLEPEEELAAEDDAQAPRPIRGLPQVPPGRRLARHDAGNLGTGGALVHDDGPTAPLAPRPAPKYPIGRHNAVYLDKDGFALPPGEITTAEAQFPTAAPPSPTAATAGSSSPSPPPDTGAAGPSAAPSARGGLTSLFARRSRSNLAAFDSKAVKALVTEEKPPPAVAEEEAEDVAQEQDAEQEKEVEEEKEVEAVVDVPGTEDKGKKRAREEDEEDVAADDAPRVQRIRTVDVRSYTKECSLLRVKVSVIPLPASGFQPGDEFLVYPPGKGPLVEKANKRSREDFEAEDDSVLDGEDEPAPKKARTEAS